jgi:hypothetical protein
MSDKRQKNQLSLAFVEEYRGEAPNDLGGGTESFTVKRKAESPAIGEQLMEEVCERENCKQALARVKANKGSAGKNGMTVQQFAGAPETVLASHPGTVAEWDLQAAAGETGGNPEAGRGNTKAWYSDGAGSIHPAGGDAGSATQMGSDIFRTQLRVWSRAVGASGGGTGAEVYR